MIQVVDSGQGSSSPHRRWQLHGLWQRHRLSCAASNSGKLIFYKRPLLIDMLPLVSQTSPSPSFVNSLHLSVLCGYFSPVQSLTRVQLFTTPWTVAHQASLSITNSQSSTQTHVHWVGDVIQPSHPLSFPSPPTFNLSQHQGFFKWVSSSHQVAKVWSFSFSISPSKEYSGLISFRVD